MEPLSEIKKSIRTIASENWKATCFIAKVVDVDGEVCTIEMDGLQLTDVRLRAVVNGETSKILITPKKESYVLVADMMGDMSQLVVMNYSEIEKIEIDAEKIVLNGGDNYGLVKIKELTEKLNALVDAFNNHTHTGTFEGIIAESVASGNIQTITMSSQHPKFDKAFYEDTKITH